MNHNQPPYGDERQFNFQGMLDGLFSGFPGGGQQFGPPGGGPPFGGPPGQTGGGPPGFQGGQPSVGPPSSPPPSFTPSQPQTLQSQQFGVYAVDPGAIRRCLYQFTYIWLRRDAFWFFPVFVGRNSIAGFRWNRNRWVYYGTELNHFSAISACHIPVFIIYCRMSLPLPKYSKRREDF